METAHDEGDAVTENMMRVCEMQRLMGPLATESEAREMIQLVAERNYIVRVDGDSHPEWREMIEEAVRRAARKAA